MPPLPVEKNSFLPSRRTHNPFPGGGQSRFAFTFGARALNDKQLLTRDLPEEHLQTVAELAVDAQGGGRFEAAVDHAVLAARVLAVAIVFPLRLVHQIVEG